MVKLRKILYVLKHGINVSDELWETRQEILKIGHKNGYTKSECPNPRRLYLFKGGEEFCIDILEEEEINMMPILRVKELTTLPVFMTDIPSSGIVGVYNIDSKWESELSKLLEGL